jgi:hypothetical protein
MRTEQASKSESHKRNAVATCMSTILQTNNDNYFLFVLMPEGWAKGQASLVLLQRDNEPSNMHIGYA